MGWLPTLLFSEGDLPATGTVADLNEVHISSSQREWFTAKPTPPAFLLSWNPERREWRDLEARIAELARKGSFDDRWRCGNTRAIPVGSRFYLLRLGGFGRGIIGGGRTRAVPTEEQRLWSYGRIAYPVRPTLPYEPQVVDVQFEFLASDPYVSWQELARPPFNAFRWTQKSGVRVREDLVAPLEELLQRRVPSDVRTAEEIDAERIYDEGAIRTVTVNAYERSRTARAACIAHHGTACCACGVRLGQRYGPIASGYIHVHHLVPVSAMGREYLIDPVRDLRPICPNCHAVAHLSEPPLSIEDLRRLLRSGSG